MVRLAILPGEAVEHPQGAREYVLDAAAWGVARPCVVAVTGALPSSAASAIDVVVLSEDHGRVLVRVDAGQVGTRYAIGVSGGRAFSLRVVAEATESMTSAALGREPGRVRRVAGRYLREGA